MNSDISRQSEVEFLDSPLGSQSSTPSFSADGLDASLDFLSQAAGVGACGGLAMSKALPGKSGHMAASKQLATCPSFGLLKQRPRFLILCVFDGHLDLSMTFHTFTSEDVSPLIFDVLPQCMAEA